MVSTYKIHEAKQRENDFTLFLESCKRAVNKIHGYVLSTKYDFWSIVENDTTMWDKLKATGTLIYSDEFMVIDFIYDCHIYAEMK